MPVGPLLPPAGALLAVENMPENIRKKLLEAFGSLVRSEEDLLEDNRS